MSWQMDADYADYAARHRLTSRLVECPECGDDFITDDPEDTWCPPCAAADRWDNP